MSKIKNIFLLLCINLIGYYALGQVNVAKPFNTAKPWTYWWWMGSAVSKKEILRELRQFKKIGIGGVQIIPIYGVKGAESKFIPYLSDRWINMLQYTLVQARKLNLGVDMSTGTGWPFGGPNVTKEIATKIYEMKGGMPVSVPTGQRVEKAAPGGEGYVLDPFSNIGMKIYLNRFDSAFAGMKLFPRAMYCDSYEVNSNWTNDFLSEFKRKRGYSLVSQWNEFQDTSSSVASELVRIDYHETIAELLLKNYAKTWIDWCRKRHMLARYQAHGSPGNLLDLYGSADIPETESFGSSNFNIPMLRVDQDFSAKLFGRPNQLTIKFASSAAHIMGQRLVSSETGTWLANHFKVSLSQLKPQIDELFAAGINHIFFHGTAYSPSDTPYPGWLYYASTNFGLSSSFYKQLPLLNRYIERCQNILQNSQPNNDILIYFPIFDIWSMPSFSKDGTDQLTVHSNTNVWLFPTPFGKLSGNLQSKGFSFDYISDEQLINMKNSGGELISHGQSYKVLIIPSCDYMPERTLQCLVKMAAAGVKIIFEGHLPKRPTGFYKYQQQVRSFLQLEMTIKKYPNVSIVNYYDDKLLEDGALENAGLAVHGLSFMRKIYEGRPIYFIANLDNKFSRGWIQINLNGNDVEKYDPLNNVTHLLPIRYHNGKLEMYLELLPGQSCFVKTNNNIRPMVSPPLAYNVQDINTKWKLTLSGGRPLGYHETFQLDSLKSWTGFSDSASYYSGVGKYTTSFYITDQIANAKDVLIDLGNVCESANVKINDKSIGTAWCIPYRLHIPTGILNADENHLEIYVTNLSVNYMRLYQLEHPHWPPFYFIDITYNPFDIKNWKAMPSGLITNIKILYR
ncbi:MAG: glycosyl hydrolase [Ginsengibacter sp.]